MEAVDTSQSDVTRPWLSVEADRLVEVLTAALQQADDEIRIATDSLVPFRSKHDCVSVHAAAGQPVAGYWGVDTAGCPILRIDTAAARFWGPAEFRRISAHEVWPGHHLIATLAAEPLHPILQGVHWLGFTEGWATYAEALASSTGPEGRLPPGMALHLLRLALLARVDVGPRLGMAGRERRRYPDSQGWVHRHRSGGDSRWNPDDPGEPSILFPGVSHFPIPSRGLRPRPVGSGGLP